MLLHDCIHTFIFINLPSLTVPVLINTIMKIIVVILCTSWRSERVQSQPGSASAEPREPNRVWSSGGLEVRSFGALAAGWGQMFKLHYQSWSWATCTITVVSLHTLTSSIIIFSGLVLVHQGPQTRMAPWKTHTHTHTEFHSHLFWDQKKPGNIPEISRCPLTPKTYMWTLLWWSKYLFYFIVF